MLNILGRNDNAAESEERGPKSVEELLPESKPTRKNLEALSEEIRSGRYASSAEHRAEVLTKAGLMSTYLDMDENTPLTIKDLRKLLVEKGIYEEEHSFWGAKNLWIALQSMGFITKQGDQFYLSKDFAPLYRRWKQLREKHDAQMIENNAEHKQILADLKEKRARELDATDDVKQAARQARREAKQAAKEARIEAYKRISEEKARARDIIEAKKEELKAEKRMVKLDKQLAALREKNK
jgi:hypothetical protein